MAERLTVGTLESTTPYIDLKKLHPEATFLRILGVNYVHLKTEDDGDLYLTEHGVPFARHLMPQSWYEPQWFKLKRQRLEGTSTVYRLPTRPIVGARPRSLDLVVKWSRVGQDVPLNTFTLDRNINAEFNTPFEEFSLVEEMRRGEFGPANLRIKTQRPLAIYVPPEQLQLWQTGRSREKILARVRRHPGVEIDVLRSYILLYGWIDGLNAVDAYKACTHDGAQLKRQLADLTSAVEGELRAKGYMVADHKPTHMILRMRDGDVMCRDGRVTYAVIDYELLARTPEHDNAVRSARRSEYLYRQRDRFNPRPASAFPAELRPAKVLGVDFVYGRVESTAGVLWVVGNDPELFPYFLPERWRTKMVRLSDTGEVYYTQTKDRIHMVWKVSRVGELPPGVLSDEGYRQILLAGYNSPFEEFALALDMQRKGVRSIYPRAIYMTSSPGEVANAVLDDRRFRSMARTLSPDGQPVLPLDHDFVAIWGYWRGLEDADAPEDNALWSPIGGAQAAAKGIISDEELVEAMARHQAAMRAAGFEDLNFKPDHILLSYIPNGPVKREADGAIATRQCNFEFVRRIG